MYIPGIYYIRVYLVYDNLVGQPAWGFGFPPSRLFSWRFVRPRRQIFRVPWWAASCCMGACMWPILSCASTATSSASRRSSRYLSGECFVAPFNMLLLVHYVTVGISFFCLSLFHKSVYAVPVVSCMITRDCIVYSAYCIPMYRVVSLWRSFVTT